MLWNVREIRNLSGKGTQRGRGEERGGPKDLNAMGSGETKDTHGKEYSNDV
jgi:hypothetical protein